MKGPVAYALVVLLCSVAVQAVRPADFMQALSQVKEHAVEELREVFRANLKPNVNKWSGEEPAFCHELDCPVFKVTENHSDYVVRQYEKAEWVGTRVADHKFELAFAMGFGRLYNYIAGGNEEEKRISMTTPVVALMPLVDTKWETTQQNYSFAFFLPFESQGKAPKPTSDKLATMEVPSGEVYVRTFSGFATEGSILEEARNLRTALQKDNKQFLDSHLYHASYDPPQRITGRHNEVWLIKRT
jgi:hypothetical protein